MHAAMILRAGFFLATTALVISCSRTADDMPVGAANTIHEQAVVIDAHAHPKPGAAETMSLGEKSGEFELDFVTMREGGLDAVFFSLPLLRGESTGLTQPEQILEDVEALKEEVGEYPELAEIALTPGDVSRIAELGKRAVLLSVETGDPLGGDVGTLEHFFGAGIRMILLPNEPITGSDPGVDGEDLLVLNEFGQRVVEEMDRLGIIIDISHANDSLQMDLIRASANPVVATHSCTRALNDVPRQIPDSIIRALAEKGGVISVTFYPGHISPHYPDSAVTVDDLVDHIDHVVQVAGIDHVGFGSDFLGSEVHTIGLESAAGLPSITSTLLERGYTQEEIEKFLGGNLMRLFKTALGNGG